MKSVISLLHIKKSIAMNKSGSLFYDLLQIILAHFHFKYPKKKRFFGAAETTNEI